MSGVGVTVGAGVSVMVGGAVGNGTVGVKVGVSAGGVDVARGEVGRHPAVNSARPIHEVAIQRGLIGEIRWPDSANQAGIGRDNVTVPWICAPSFGDRTLV